MPLLTTLSTLAGAFGNWAFRSMGSKNDDEKKDDPKP